MLVNAIGPSPGCWLSFSALKPPLAIFVVCTIWLSIFIPLCLDDEFFTKPLAPCLVQSGEACARVGLIVDLVGKRSDFIDTCELSSQTLVSEIVNDDSS